MYTYICFTISILGYSFTIQELDNDNNDIDDDEIQEVEQNNVTTILNVNMGGVRYKKYVYHKSGVVKNGVIYYRCSQKRSLKCRATLNISENGVIKCNNKPHNHNPKPKSNSLLQGKLFTFVLI